MFINSTVVFLTRTKTGYISLSENNILPLFSTSFKHLSGLCFAALPLFSFFRVLICCLLSHITMLGLNLFFSPSHLQYFPLFFTSSNPSVSPLLRQCFVCNRTSLSSYLNLKSLEATDLACPCVALTYKQTAILTILC